MPASPPEVLHSSDTSAPPPELDAQLSNQHGAQMYITAPPFPEMSAGYPLDLSQSSHGVPDRGSVMPYSSGNPMVQSQSSHGIPDRMYYSSAPPVILPIMRSGQSYSQRSSSYTGSAYSPSNESNAEYVFSNVPNPNHGSYNYRPSSDNLEVSLSREVNSPIHDEKKQRPVVFFFLGFAACGVLGPLGFLFLCTSCGTSMTKDKTKKYLSKQEFFRLQPLFLSRTSRSIDQCIANEFIVFVGHIFKRLFPQKEKSTQREALPECSSGLRLEAF